MDIETMLEENGEESTSITPYSNSVQSEAYYHELFDRCTSAVIVYDPVSLTLTDCNEAALTSLGYSRSQMLGRPVESLGGLLSPQILASGLKPMLDGSKPSVTCLGHVQRKDGSAYPVRFNFFRVFHSTEKRIAIVAQSVSERLNHDEQARRQLAVQERERKNLAAVLHDSVSQSLMSMLLDLKGRRAVDGSSENDELIEELGRTLEQVRGITSNLMPPWISEIGLAAGLRAHCKRQARIGKFALSLNLKGDLDALDDALKCDCFRIVQEAISNVIRHAGATVMTIRICSSRKGLQIDLRDDGCGFDSAALGRRASDMPGLGLFGMRDRAKAMHGQFRIHSRPGRGTHVRVFFPMRAEKDLLHMSLMSHMQTGLEGAY